MCFFSMLQSYHGRYSEVPSEYTVLTQRGRMPGMHLYAGTHHLLWLVPSAHIVCVGKSHTHIGCHRLSSCTFSGYAALYLKSAWEYYMKAGVRFWPLSACSMAILFYWNNYSGFSIDSHDPTEGEKWEKESMKCSKIKGFFSLSAEINLG